MSEHRQPTNAMARIVERVEGKPLGSIAGAIEEAGGVEEEFFVEGTAVRFRPRPGPDAYPVDGRWAPEAAETAPFGTRILVNRPADPAKFNGTVIANWNNVSGGESFQTPTTGARLVRDGFAVVGVSAQRAGLEGISGRQVPALKINDPQRYESLAHPGDDWSYDIYTQVGQLIGPNRPRGIDPLGGLSVSRVVTNGGSQSGARLFGYVNGVHAGARVFDGFVITLCPNLPCALIEEDAPPDAPEMNWPQRVGLLEWHRYLLRDDLGVPIIVVNSETEAADCYPNTQPESDDVRVWEVAGTGHAGQLRNEELTAYPAIASIDHSEVSLAPVLREALNAMNTWLSAGEAPPHHPRIARQAGSKMFVRDEHGNALGGIRMPELEAPLATYVGEAAALGQSGLSMGKSTPLDPETVASLWPDHATWHAAYERAATALVADRVLHPDDAAEMVALAADTPLPT